MGQCTRLLIVDDDTNLLAGLRRAAYSERHIWSVETESDPRKALSRLEQAQFDVVISDMRMPEISGVDVLAKTRETQPEATRIILSGHSDHDSAMRSVQHAHQYLAKPCEFSDIQALVQRLATLRDILTADAVRSRVANMTALPSMPAVYRELSAALEDEETTAQSIGSLVAQDPAMTAKLLQLVNSSFFGLQRSVASPKEAVSLLGTEVIRGLMVQVGVFDATDESVRQRFNLDALCRQAFQVARIAQVVAECERLPRQYIEASYSGGLLHNVGILLLAQNFPDEWSQILQMQSQQDGAPHLIEDHILGCNHMDVGAYLLNLWGLPDGVVESVALQNRPAEQTGDELNPTSVVSIARALGAEPDASQAHLDGMLERYHCQQRLEPWLKRLKRCNISLGHG